MTRMPFGAHKGTPIDQIPPGYLDWVLKNCTDLNWWLRREIEAVLAAKAAELEARARPVPTDKARAAVKTVFREMAMAYHPDHRGGSTEAMAAINEMYSRLNAALAELS